MAFQSMCEMSHAEEDVSSSDVSLEEDFHEYFHAKELYRDSAVEDNSVQNENIHYALQQWI